MNLSCRAVFAIGLLVFLLGCSSGPEIVPVKGTATRDGKPIKGLFLRFYPPNDARPSWGYTDDEGRFELEYARDQKGAIAGTHTVTAELKSKELDYTGKGPDAEKTLNFEKYRKKETSKMIVEVKRNEEVELKFD